MKKIVWTGICIQYTDCLISKKRRERDLNPRMLAHTGSQGPRPTELGDLCEESWREVIKIC